MMIFSYAWIAVLLFNFIQGIQDNCGDNKNGLNRVYLQDDNSTYIVSTHYVNSSCSWLLTASTGFRAIVGISQLNFKFSMESCEEENFKIYDGNSTSNSLLATYCASNKPKPNTLVEFYLSGINGMIALKQGDAPSPRKVFFVSTQKTNKDSCHDGKLLNLKATTAVSNFTSPDYPRPYPTGTSGLWLIEAPPGKYVKLAITDISYYFCKGTSLNVYDGDSENSKKLIRNLCSKTENVYWIQFFPKITFFSMGQKILVSSQSIPFIRYPINNKGFQVYYSAVDQVTSCGARHGDAVIQLIDSNGTIQSPNYPSYHPSNLTCHWKVSISAGKIIEITNAKSVFPDDCSKQWVRIYDGYSTSSPEILQLCSYKHSSKSVFSSSNHLLVEFVTKDTRESKGFSITYIARKVKPKPYACLDSKTTQIINATSGRIASQRFPLLYSNQARCQFNIQVPIGYFLYITFTTFDLGNIKDEKCNGDYVHIRSVDKFGKWEKSAVLCGKKKTPFSYISATNKVTVYFESDDTGQHQGYEATYQRIQYLPQSASCGQNALNNKIESSSGTIASYEYPLKYQNNVQCTWVISTTSSLYKLRVKFDYMDIEPSPGCKDDYVEVRDGGHSFSDSLGKFCGSTKPDSFKSSESSIFVEFKTNGTGRYGGFKMTYEKTYNWKGILLILGCSIIAVIVVIGAVLFVRKFYCVKKQYSGIETVNMEQAVS